MQADVNGTRLNYTVEGAGPWLTLAHPLGVDHAVWDEIAAHFATRFTVLRYDSRGHGASAVPPGPYTLPMLAADLKGLLDALNVAHTHFAGISMGGTVGQQFALDHPGMLNSMTLIDTTSQTDVDAANALERRAALALADGMDALVDATLERWLTAGFRQRHPDAAERVGQALRATPPQGYAACCAALRQAQLTERLDQIRCPTLVLVGEADTGAPVATAQLIASRIRGARLAIIDDAAHLSIVEQPQAIIAQMETFMAIARSNE